MVYVGSTLTPTRRLHNYLVTGLYSNTNLQQAIHHPGLSQFTLYIFETVQFPNKMTSQNKMILLHQVEQNWINKFPKNQLYNFIYNSSF